MVSSSAGTSFESLSVASRQKLHSSSTFLISCSSFAFSSLISTVLYMAPATFRASGSARSISEKIHLSGRFGPSFMIRFTRRFTGSASPNPLLPKTPGNFRSTSLMRSSCVHSSFAFCSLSSSPPRSCSSSSGNFHSSYSQARSQATPRSRPDTRRLRRSSSSSSSYHLISKKSQMPSLISEPDGFVYQSCASLGQGCKAGSLSSNFEMTCDLK